MAKARKTVKRLLVKVTRETLPQIKDKYPFVYLERGRLEIDDSSIKWIDATNQVVPLPVATLNCLLLGPGTNITRSEEHTSKLQSRGHLVCRLLLEQKNNIVFIYN